MRLKRKLILWLLRSERKRFSEMAKTCTWTGQAHDFYIADCSLQYTKEWFCG